MSMFLSRQNSDEFNENSQLQNFKENTIITWIYR